MATEEPTKSEVGGPADVVTPEPSLEVKTLKEKIAKLTADNTRLKNELRFTMQHQKRMSDESVESLQHDIDVLTARNNKLSNELMKTEADLQTVRHAKAQLEADYRGNVTSQATALIEQLTKAQQEHEKEIQTELSEAIRWRERVITKMQEMDINIEDIFEDDFEKQRDSSCPMEERLQSLVESLRREKSTVAMQKTGVLIVEEIRRKRDGNQKKIQELIDFLRQESEAANSKKFALENDVTRLRQKIEMIETEFKLVDKQRVKILQSQLKAAITEKDDWKKRAIKFEDALETLKIITSLQKSLSKEEDIKRKYEKEFHRSQAEKIALTNQLEAALQERNKCVRERNEVIQERNSLALQVQQEYERAERLHRLVIVLRKKAHNSAGSARSPLPASYEL